VFVHKGKSTGGKEFVALWTFDVPQSTNVPAVNRLATPFCAIAEVLLKGERARAEPGA
jgi:hypothetical protein